MLILEKIHAWIGGCVNSFMLGMLSMNTAGVPIPKFNFLTVSAGYRHIENYSRSACYVVVVIVIISKLIQTEVLRQIINQSLWRRIQLLKYFHRSIAMATKSITYATPLVTNISGDEIKKHFLVKTKVWRPQFSSPLQLEVMGKKLPKT